MVEIIAEVVDLCRLGTAEPDTAAIAELLRSGRCMTPQVRVWLADLFDGKLPYRFDMIRRPGKPRSHILRHMNAVEFLENLLEKEKLSLKQAEYLTTVEFGIKKSTLYDSWAKIKKAREDNNRIYFDNLEN